MLFTAVEVHDMHKDKQKQNSVLWKKDELGLVACSLEHDDIESEY